VKTVLDALYDLLDARKGSFPKKLREEFDAYWLAFAQQIRTGRNDAGHPSSVDPVTEEGVHASYLVGTPSVTDFKPQLSLDLTTTSDNLAVAGSRPRTAASTALQSRALIN
jgi:hypothetical protein